MRASAHGIDHARPRVAHLQDELMPSLPNVYNGFWFAPEREMLQAADRRDAGMSPATFVLNSFEGNAIVVGVARHSLYDEKVATFEETRFTTSAMLKGSSSSTRCDCARSRNGARSSSSSSNQAQCVIARFRRAIQYSPLKWVRSATGSAHRDASAPAGMTGCPRIARGMSVAVASAS